MPVAHVASLVSEMRLTATPTEDWLGLASDYIWFLESPRRSFGSLPGDGMTWQG